MLSIGVVGIPNTSLCWTPNDIDVYIPFTTDHVPDLVMYMTGEEKYDVLPVHSSALPGPYPDISRVISLQRQQQ
jgi:hypothetical protein